MIPNQNAIKNGKAHYSPETRISGPPDSSIHIVIKTVPSEISKQFQAKYINMIIALGVFAIGWAKRAHPIT